MEEPVQPDRAADLRTFLEKKRFVRKSQITDDNQSLLESGLIDSLAVMEITTYMEDAYGVQVDDDDLIPDNFDSIAAMAAYVERKIG